MKKTLVAIVTALLLSLSHVPGASALSMWFTPSTASSVSIGGTYSWDIVISGLQPGSIVGAYDLDVIFNSTALTATSVTFGPWLGNASQEISLGVAEVYQGWSSSGGILDLWAMSMFTDAQLQALQAPANGTLTLATLNFTGIANGTPGLDFSWGPGQDVKLNGSDPVIPSTPEPGTLLLIGSGIAALYPLRRRLS